MRVREMVPTPVLAYISRQPRVLLGRPLRLLNRGDVGSLAAVSHRGARAAACAGHSWRGAVPLGTVGRCSTRRFCASPAAVDVSAAAEASAPASLEALEARLRELLDAHARPFAQSDGGDIEFVRFDAITGIVFVRMRGACAGCSKSNITLGMMVKKTLQHYCPEVLDIEAIEDDEDEGIDDRINHF
eukprot:TRINITY_DN74320_c0_g1_i1.p1 TRINITY_DN74320_c0_g1~~TRINITY_DN74320_c0_g1_i1.p1  ORF type:complete len:187 (-),score=46.62 TRINITY_DN74320_c0_g1_i1:119-679(-)